MRKYPKYYKDYTGRIITKVEEPTFREEKTKHRNIQKRKRKGWIVSADAKITNADNNTDDYGNWKYPVSWPFHKNYDKNDEMEKVESFFEADLRKEYGKEIIEEDFKALKSEYDKEIKSRIENLDN